MDTHTFDEASAQSTSEASLRLSRERVAARAYERYQQRGGTHGHDCDDWLDAEREVHEEAQSTMTSGE